VDCLSHASITQIGGTDWNGNRLSLGGVSSLALNNFLENNPNINNVYLCLDNDKPSKEALERISKEILSNEKYNHINIFIAPPPVGKDYNDTLLFMHEKIKERDLHTHTTAAEDIPKANADKKRSEMAL
jgi:hypothetical protein